MNIIINIGNIPTLLKSNENCYELCFKRSQRGIEVWTPEKYYSTLASAFSALLEMKIRASTATTLNELKSAIENARLELQALYSSECRIEEDIAR